MFDPAERALMRVMLSVAILIVLLFPFIYHVLRLKTYQKHGTLLTAGPYPSTKGHEKQQKLVQVFLTQQRVLIVSACANQGPMTLKNSYNAKMNPVMMASFSLSSASIIRMRNNSQTTWVCPRWKWPTHRILTMSLSFELFRRPKLKNTNLWETLVKKNLISFHHH